MAMIHRQPTADWDVAARDMDKAPFRKILVAVGSQDADVLRYAAGLANESGAAVHVVHIRERELYGGRAFTPESAEQAERVLDKALSDLRAAGITATGS